MMSSNEELSNASLDAALEHATAAIEQYDRKCGRPPPLTLQELDGLETELHNFHRMRGRLKSRSNSDDRSR